MARIDIEPKPAGVWLSWYKTAARLGLRPGLTLAVIVGLSAILSCAEALTRRPWCDEAWFASPAYNLIHRGFMGMTVLDPHGFPFAPLVKDIDRLTYWVMPGYIIAQAVWYKLVGFSLFSMRALSVLWSLIALLSWYHIMKWLTHRNSVALLATFLLGVEQYFVRSAAAGRMDMMCAALWLAGVALYVRYRQKMELALLLAACCLAAALFTHPNALFGLVLLGVLVLSYDAKRVTIRSLALASMPFVILGGLWATYVLRAPRTFANQMAAQSTIPHRFEPTLNLVASAMQEVSLRYAPSYRLHSTFPVALVQIVFYSYLAALLMAAFVPGIRRAPGVRPLLVATAIVFILLSFLQKNYYYLVHILPFLTAMVALASAWWWTKGLSAKIAVCTLLLVFAGLNVGIVVMRAEHNDYKHRYLKAVDYLRRNIPPGSLTMGSGELAFQLGFDGQVIDDTRLGYGSGKRPDYIVLEAQYYQFWFPLYSITEPKTFEYLKTLLSEEYDLIYDQTKDAYSTRGSSDAPYQIYERISIEARSSNGS